MIKRLALASILGLSLAFMVGTSFARAQGLPQVPSAASKTAQGGMTAGASVEREGGSALEPYLVTWLIPLFGVIIFGTCIVADKKTRASV